MVNEKEFLQNVEKIKNENPKLKRLKEFEKAIRLALDNGHTIKNIQKTLKQVYKINVKEYALKQFVKNVMKYEKPKKTQDKKTFKEIEKTVKTRTVNVNVDDDLGLSQF